MLLALALLLAWRCVLRPAARELSPRWLAGRLPAEWDRGAAGSLRDTLGVRTVRAPGRPQRRSVSWRAVALLVVSLALGVVSHIAWDLFTHEGRGGVDLFPALAEQWGPLAGYKWLQHGSSIVGLAILAVSAVVWLRRRRVAASVPCLLPSWVRWTWWLSLPVILMLAWVDRTRRLRPAGCRVHDPAPGVPGASAGVRRVGTGHGGARRRGAGAAHARARRSGQVARSSREIDRPIARASRPIWNS